MRKNQCFSLILPLLAGSLLAGGCVTRERVVYRHPAGHVVVTETIGAETIVTEAPPPPVAEVITVAPDPHFVWIGGGWIWRGQWVWERGHWDRPPRVGAVWVPHHYVYRGGHHIFIRGGWR